MDQIELSYDLYIGCARSNDIVHCRLNAQSGFLSKVSHLALPDVQKFGGTLPLAISPEGQHLYAACRGEPHAIHTFLIKNNGALVHQKTTNIEKNLAYIWASKYDDILYSASYVDHDISLYQIDNDHTIGKSPISANIGAHSHMFRSIKRDGQMFAFASSLGSDQICMWSAAPFIKHAALEQPDTTLQLAKGTGPRHIGFHPTLNFIYVIGELNGTITAIQYTQNKLTVQQEMLLSACLYNPRNDIAAADIHIRHDGQFLYASEKCSSTIDVFALNEKGAMSHVQTVQTEERPRSIALTRDSVFLIAAGQSSNHIACYAIHPHSGHLTFKSRLKVGKSPDWIELRPV
ncbi:lactonase family protein [Marinomonas balearica]|uniref:6-phosphogluconolactonase n=1 Tax=Marinomonas balearica TaxID=491947 RepID=A0A4R6MH54_9GAMM|nr:beta-propeller fold lactonase family protein [Marinomonas balearica]TDP01258.1 6-phosphogluconolactonase [Marinomonas balearica]